VTLADAATTVARAASESADAAFEASGAAPQRIAVAAAALVLPVLWGLAVHLVFNWLARRRGETSSEETVLQDYQI
jgi:hypothetical protein